MEVSSRSLGLHLFQTNKMFSSDEIIRQVTINCAERGLLLLRVRDELRMTVAAYQALYESSIAFGMRKALQVLHQWLYKKIWACTFCTN